MKFLFTRLWIVDLVLFILVVIGLLNLYSTSANEAFTFENVLFRQAIFVVVGAVLYLALGFIDYNVSRTIIVQTIGLGGIILLLMGLFVFAPDLNETRRWYQLGGFLFQPSEYAKITIIAWTAFWLSFEGKSRFGVLLPIGAAVGIVSLLILVEPDLGTTIITLFIAGLMVIVRYYRNRIFQVLAGAVAVYGVLGVYLTTTQVLHVFPWSWAPLIALAVVAVGFTALVLIKLPQHALYIGISALGVTGLIALGLTSWNFILRDYQRERFSSFFTRSQEEANFQVKQAKIAIGSGQWFGKGLGQGTQSRLRFLPEYQTDFMFAAYVEEWGFVGGLLLVALYLILLLRMIFLALHVSDPYGQLLVIGLTTKLWIEVFINLSMNMGLIPTKGIPLPFVSYGGSAILSGFIVLAIVQSVYRYRTGRAVATETNFTFD